ncbi:MAG: SDR family NAD(P)-dependent oxidoreductase [Melioribacteraceae bacterium]|nr:SDR family NAD(P)-dependent oxidoreductase [Melioribacteraceae bacterium]
MDLENKNILITGASSGIGEALVKSLAEYKCTLFLISRNMDKLREMQNNLSSFPAEINIYRCDVSKKDEVKLTAAEMLSKSDTIDLAILNAGISRWVFPENYNSADAEETFGTNFLGMIYWIENLLPKFIERKKGTIAAVSSLADNRGYSGSGFYCASKAAISMYFEGLAVDLNSYNIKVVTIKPGFVKTPMTDKNDFMMPFLITPEKAADIIIKGLIKEKRYIIFPYVMYMLTRLVGLIPDRLYEFFARQPYFKVRNKQSEN